MVIEHAGPPAHGIGLFCDSKPHILEDVDTELVPGMALIVHPNTYHPEVGYLVLGDAVVVTDTGVEVLCRTLFWGGSSGRLFGVNRRAKIVAAKAGEMHFMHDAG